jgi:hypothetical protein
MIADQDAEEADWIEDVQVSRARGMSRVWWVAEDYTIQDGVIYQYHAGLRVPSSLPTNSEAQYLPLSRPELLSEFPRLVDATEPDLLKFVKRYGLLGYPQAQDTPGLHDGDPVSWVLAHAATLKLVMELAAALNEPMRLNSTLERLTERHHTGQLGIVYTIAERGELYLRTIHARKLDNPQEQALKIVADILNRNLKGISRYVELEQQPDGRLGLTSLFAPRNLLDCIYSMAADAVVARKIRMCTYCGRPFVAISDRMQYCPPRMGLRSVSPCMNNAKQKRFKQKRRR